MSSQTQAPTLYLIDGHAQMFRAFFAIRTPMTSPVTGEPTGASFAFTGMLLRLFLEQKPTYHAMAIDTKEPTFRNEIYPEYKAQREAPPEQFEQQIPRMLEIAEAFGIPVLQSPGAEADDIIATLVDRYQNNIGDWPTGLEVSLVSKDKDLEQLLNEHVQMLDILTGEFTDPEKLQEKRGIRPDQAVDLQTLCGDSVDNIPGVPGIGPKTGAKLLAEFGTVENLMENLDQIKGKRRENLEAFREQWPLTRRLVTLNRQVDIAFDLETAKAGRIDAMKLHHIFRDLGFHRHVRDLEKLTGVTAEQARLQRGVTDDAPSSEKGSASSRNKEDGVQAFGLFAQIDEKGEIDESGVSVKVPHNEGYRSITQQAELDALVKELEQQEVLAIDTETLGLGDNTGLCGICLSWKAGEGVYIPVKCPGPVQPLDTKMILESLMPTMQRSDLLKIGHNLKYDYLVLRRAGLPMCGPFFDTMVAAFLLNEPGMKLDDLALSQLQHAMIPIERLIGPKPSGRNAPRQKSMVEIELDLVTQYAAEDADITLRLYEQFHPRLKTLGLEELAEQIEMPLVQVLAEMERTGIRVEPAILDEQREKMQVRIDTLRDDIHEAAGMPFNIDSPKQLAEVLFTHLDLPVVKRTRTGISTDAEVLDKLVTMEDLPPEKVRVPELVVEYRQLTKLVGTYLSALKEAIDPDTHRVHARFHQTGAATGRLSSSDPNLQNIPIRTDLGRQIRKAFVAEPDYRLVSADYSQIELRMLAHLSEDTALIEAFNEGMDIHTAVAAQVFDVDPDAVTSEQRGHAKTINFGIIYGVTPYGLARRIENLDLDGAKQLISDYKKRFSGIDAFLQKCVKHAKDHGFVRTMMGRRREIPQITARNGQTRALGERLAINTVVQGSAADLIKLAMVQLYQRIAADSLPMRMLLQIHDELVVETPEAHAEKTAAIVCETMENAMSLKVPLKAEPGVGRDWFEAK